MEEWANILEFWENKPIEYKQADRQTDNTYYKEILREYMCT